MKRINSAVSSDGIAELEVIECDCGYHMGIDASFVDQVDEAFFDAPTFCPSCKEEINVRELLEMEPLTVEVEVSRTCSASRMVRVKANSMKQAEYNAMDEAGDYEFSEKDADYETQGGYVVKEQPHL